MITIQAATIPLNTAFGASAVSQPAAMGSYPGMAGAAMFPGGAESFIPTWETAAMMQGQGFPVMGGAGSPMGSIAQLNMIAMWNGQMDRMNMLSMLTMLIAMMKQILTGKAQDGAAGASAAPSSYDSSGTGGASSTGASSGAAGSTAPVTGVPHGLSQIQAMFGAPGTDQVTVQMPAGPGGKMISVTCHRKIADKMKAAFEEIKAKGLSHLIHSFDGSFNNRNKRGGSTKSTHAWGISFDVNASENPMGSSRQTAGQRQLAEIFAKYGFYQLPNDPMHFQFCRGY